MRRLVLTAIVALGMISAAQAATVAYKMDPASSTVAFETDFGPDKITGAFPLERADLQLDFDNVRNCTVEVALDVTGATASFPFAAQALKGPKVLAAKDHPRMTFASTSVKGAGDTAEVTGISPSGALPKASRSRPGSSARKAARRTTSTT